MAASRLACGCCSRRQERQLIDVGSSLLQVYRLQVYARVRRAGCQLLVGAVLLGQDAIRSHYSASCRVLLPLRVEDLAGETFVRGFVSRWRTSGRRRHTRRRSTLNRYQHAARSSPPGPHGGGPPRGGLPRKPRDAGCLRASPRCLRTPALCAPGGTAPGGSWPQRSCSGSRVGQGAGRGCRCGAK